MRRVRGDERSDLWTDTTQSRGARKSEDIFGRRGGPRVGEKRRIRESEERISLRATGYRVQDEVSEPTEIQFETTERRRRRRKVTLSRSRVRSHEEQPTEYVVSERRRTRFVRVVREEFTRTRRD